MAEFKPFRGIRYNIELIKDFSQVVTPPYDVISPAERDHYHERHPHNVIRLILGKPQPEDNDQNNVHTRAAQFLDTWLDNKVLLQDSKPGFYLTSVSFDLFGRHVTRYGVTGWVRLEPFDKGIVLPHEKTFSKVKAERLSLIKACQANLCPIFGLYSDKNGIAASLISSANNFAPDIELTDDKGLMHRLWYLADDQMIADLTDALKNQTIYIADGHHRYETALNFREWFKENNGSYTLTHPSNYVMMSLISMEDPGLIILPAHRLLSSIPQESLDRFFAQAPQYFDIKEVPIQDSMERAAEKTWTLLKENTAKNAIGVYAKNQKQIHIMILKSGIMEQNFGHEMHPALLDPDVSVLNRLIMMELLSFDKDRMDDENQIAYRTEVYDALRAVSEQTADICFLLNPTKMEHVKRIAENRLIMPRKATYFYPKEISGMVFNLLK
jgi:uncharacterized protein (DUF1015 family)